MRDHQDRRLAAPTARVGAGQGGRVARSKNSGGATSRSRVAIKLSIRKGAINGMTKNT